MSTAESNTGQAGERPGLIQQLEDFKYMLEQFAMARIPLAQVEHDVRALYMKAAVKVEKLDYSKAAESIGVHRNTIIREIGPRWKVKHEIARDRREGVPHDAAAVGSVAGNRSLHTSAALHPEQGHSGGTAEQGMGGDSTKGRSD